LIYFLVGRTEAKDNHSLEKFIERSNYKIEEGFNEMKENLVHPAPEFEKRCNYYIRKLENCIKEKVNYFCIFFHEVCLPVKSV
jgi:hypothetical protein